MPAYMIVEVEVTNPVQYEAYKKLTPAIIAAHGGKYLARGGQTIRLQGDWDPQRLIILEFESVEQATAWWSSPEFSALKPMRDASAHTNMVLIEGVSAQPD